MKTYIKVLVIIVLYIGLISLNTNVYAATGTIAKDTVRLRSKASTDSKTVQLLPIGQEVEIISEEDEWYKVKYITEDVTYTGYVRTDMVNLESDDNTNSVSNNTTANEVTSTDTSEENETKNETEELQTETVKTESDDEIKEESVEEPIESTSSVVEEIKENDNFKINSKLEIKLLPVINSSNIATMEKGTQVIVSEIIGNWVYLQAEEQSGWVLLSKVQKQQEVVESEEQPEKEEKKEEVEEKEVEKEEEKEEVVEEKKEETKTVNNTAISTTKKTMYISASTVNFREEASSSSKILQQLSINTKVTVLEKIDNEWSKVQVSGVTGYIASAYLSDEKTEVTSRGDETTRDTSSDAEENKEEKEVKEETSTTETKKETTQESKEETSSNTTSSTTGADVVQYAKKYLGCKYVYGGTSPSGFDCSGFTQYVYKHFGYSLSRTSSSQRNNGISVSKSNLKVGDLVCFSGHVGIYVGNNKFIHAENSSSGVKISSLSESYYSRTYITARRIIY